MKVLFSSITLLLFLFQVNYLSAQSDAMNYTELQNYLPESISGYQAEKPTGQTFNMGGMSYSNAEITFRGSNGTIRVSILDYSGAAAMYQAATAVWSTGMSFEDDEKKAQTVKFSDNIVGMEEYKKIAKEAYLALGVGNRFFVSIEAENQENVNFVHKIAEDMDLEKLANK